jgi:tripartite-type tricarboxylate transporter receptor subunit TctC
MRRRVVTAGLGGLLAAPLLLRAEALAQGAAEARWPTREISLITGFGPGGGTDVVARALAAHMEKTLGATVVVRNMPGAGGTLGPAAVARSRPDGYTFGLVAASAVLVAPLTMETPYRPWESFDFLCGTSELRIGIPVGPSLPNVRSLEELIAVGKRQRIHFGTTNPGSAVSFFDLKRMTGADFSYVAFGSITEAATQVAGGHIDTYTGTPEMIPLVKGGQLRMLASASVDRWPEFPEVPTLREMGYDTVTRQLIGFAVPAGTPVAIRERLSAALLDAARDPAVQARQAGASIAPRPMTRGEYIAALREVQPGIEEALRLAGVVRVR